MVHKHKVGLAAISAFLCGLCLCNQVFAQALPDGKGKAEFVHNCTACHRADMVTRVKKTPDEWRKSVDEMAARGTDGTKEDLDNVVLYLDKYFALEPPAPDHAKQPATPSSTSDHPTGPTHSDVEHVEHFIAESSRL
jgi:hypothetical protein